MITDEQWAMPVTFDAAGEPVTLREYADGKRPFLPLAALSEDQWLALAAARIVRQAGYELSSLGSGRIGRERAVAEVRAKTELGRRLARVETRVVVHLTDEVAKRRS